MFCKTDNKSLEEQLKSSKVIQDNKSLEEQLKSSKVKQDFRLSVDIARLQEIVKFGEIEVQWVDKTHQLANPLTKYGASAVHLMDVFKCRKLWDENITKICI